MLRRVAAFCQPLRPVLMLVSFVSAFAEPRGGRVFVSGGGGVQWSPPAGPPPPQKGLN